MANETVLNLIRIRAQDSSTRTDMMDVAPIDIFPPSSPEILAQIERRLSFELPALLRSIYLRVGNGGFGPGYGLLGTPGGHTDQEGRSLLSCYEFMLSEYGNEQPSWPAGILPICEWGSQIWSCVDCMSSISPVITFCDEGLFKVGYDVQAWFKAWAEGKSIWSEMFELRIVDIMNPFTGKATSTHVRGAPKGQPLL